MLDSQVEPPEKEQLGEPVVDLVRSEQMMRRLQAAVLTDHLEEPGRPVAEPSGRS